MLSASYAATAAAMLVAALYLFFRLRPFLTTTTMLLGSLLLIYGPAYLSFMQSSGEDVMPIKWMIGDISRVNPIFSAIKARVADFDGVVIAMNFAIALMYVGIIVGIETVDRLVPRRIEALRIALANWNSQTLRDDVGGVGILLGAVSILILFLLFVSFRENHIGTIKGFLSAAEGDRIAYRFRHGGSPNYLYGVILGTIAPMLVIWGLLAGWLKRSWGLFSLAFLLLLAIAIGKSESLSKAPPAFFLLQLIVAITLIFTNRLTLRSTVGAVGAVLLVLYSVVRVAVTYLAGASALIFIYTRVFEVPSQALFENFAVFPALHPHTWGANIRPIAALMGVNYTPSFTIVAQIWQHITNETSVPALFIADAWTDFSYAGVIVFSLFAGAFCRLIDAMFLVHGKTVVAIAVLGATFIGVFTLLFTALNIALVSGGLLLAPLLAGLLMTAIRYSGPRPVTSKDAARKE
jgi:hypothetical protein